MAKTETSKRDAEQELTRRALIKWSLAAGAALGVSKAGVFEILEKTAGKGIAMAAGESVTTRSIHLIGGNGGFAHFQLLFPHYDVALAANPNLSFQAPGTAQLMEGTNKPWVRHKDLPFANLPPQRQWTAMMAGSNETHTNGPTSMISLNGSNVMGVVASLQQANASVVPVITIGNVNYAQAAGSPQATAVTQATGMVDLFNSAASRMGGILANTNDANLYKAQYDAFAQLNRAANRSTTKLAYTTASGAAQFLGTNLRTKLEIQPADLTRYGVTGNTRGNVAAIARAFIITVKAFKMGLTNSVILPAMLDDPHGAFNGGVGNRDADIVPVQLKTVFDALMADLIATKDDATLRSLDQDTVISIHGDTPKSPTNPGGWPDGTPNGSNWMYIWGAGHLRTGWFGGVDRNGNARGYDANGNDAPYNAAATARFATATLAYAVAKRDDRLISQFANGIKVSGVFGLEKVQ